MYVCVCMYTVVDDVINVRYKYSTAKRIRAQVI